MQQTVFFIGIGGIGMSALARWYAARGASVAGYDRSPSDLTRALESEHIRVAYGEQGVAAAKQLTGEAEKNGQVPLVIRTPAVSEEHAVCQFFQGRDIPLLKRSEVLGALTKNRPTLAVAGTHGKTTTSALLAHMLSHAGLPCDAFLGGLLAPFGTRESATNMLLDPSGAQAPWTVVEADEFDRSFLTLSPKAAVITSADADHLDIYGDAGALHDAFRQFAKQVESGGLILHYDAAASLNIQGPTYGWALQGADEPTFTIHDFLVKKGRSHFRITLPSGPVNIDSTLAGRHNAENTQAAALLAEIAGADRDQIRRAMRCFPGVHRRFQIHTLGNGKTIVSDYAHHPVELQRVIEAAREQFSERNIAGIFQPHLYSRTKDFAREFGKALSDLDRCWVAPIFPAREEPIPGVDSHLILENIKGIPAETSDVSTFLSSLEPASIDVILVLGAGDIDRLIPDLISRLEA